MNLWKKSGSTYIPLSQKLGSSVKGLINLKNKDHKCFAWCHVRLINPSNSHPERINKQDKTIAANLNYSDIEFRWNISDYELIENRFEMNISLIYFKKISHTNS